MVKGVNKSIIEISQTGNKYFSKIVLYVAPEYSEIYPKRLSREAKKIFDDMNIGSFEPLRVSVKKEKTRKLLIFLAAAVLFISLTTAVVLIL